MMVGLETEGGVQNDKPVILCVEDEEDLRTDLVEELQDAGYGVIEAHDGAQALAQISVVSPDLILCDINLPDHDGYDVLRDLREQRPDLADVPFIFLTALADSREIVKGKRAGADDYLVKPVDFDLMLATIEARLREVRRMQHKAADEINSVRAALTNLHAMTAQNMSEWAPQALDYVALGVVALDRHAQVLFANRAARQLAEDGDALLLDDRLRPALVRHERPLKNAIDRAIQVNGEGEETPIFLRVPRISGRRDLMVVICALPHTGGEGGEAQALVFIADGERRLSVPRNVLAALFGLTPTESQIALMLAEGARLDEIGVSLNVSSTTIAFHMRNLFQKTSTNRQADLIALVLAGPMAMVLG